MERGTQLYSFPSLTNIHPLFHSSHKPCQKVSVPARFHQQILLLFLQNRPRICPLLTLSGHHSGPSCHPLSPGSSGSPHQLTPNFPPPIYAPYRPALASHHTSQPGLQPTSLLAVPQAYQALSASGPLYSLCSWPVILSHWISTWRLPHLLHTSAPSPYTEAFPDLPISNSSPSLSPFLLYFSV